MYCGGRMYQQQNYYLFIEISQYLIILWSDIQSQKVELTYYLILNELQ